MTRPLVRHALIFGGYLLLAILVTFPLMMHFSTDFAGFPYGDAYENARMIWWWGHALRTGEPLFFQPLLGYPNGLDGFTLQAHLLQFFPAWLFALVLPLPAAHNLQLLLSLALNGYLMFAFARTLVRRDDAALVAGVVFLAYPAIVAHLGAAHTGLLHQWTVVLYAWAVLTLTLNPSPSGRGTFGTFWFPFTPEKSAGLTGVPPFALREKGLGDEGDGRMNPAPTGRQIILVTVAFLLVGFTHTIQIIYAVVPITLFFVVGLLWRRAWGALARLAAAWAVAALVLAIYLLPVFGAASSYSDDGGDVRYSADLLAPVTPSFLHPVYGNLDYTHRVLGVNLEEGAGYIGVIGGALALIGVWTTRAARGWLALAAVLYLLSLGPLLKLFDQPVALNVDGYRSFVALPWAFVQGLPIFELARTPGRFNMTAGLAIAVMAAFGAAWLLARVRLPLLRRSVAIACAALLLFDYQTFNGLPTTPAYADPGVSALREREDVRAIFMIPWDDLVAAKEALYLQTLHQQPLIAGHVTRRTPVDPALLTLLQDTLDPALLRAAGADIVIVQTGYLQDAAQLDAIRARLGEPIYVDERVAIFETLQADAPQFTTSLTDNAPAALERQHQTYLYTPAPGWALYTVTPRGNGEALSLTLDGRVVWRGAADGAPIRVPLPLTDSGFYTAALHLEPPCPLRLLPGTVCRSVTLDELQIGTIVDGTFGDVSGFERGVWLGGAQIAPRADDERSVSAWLWWQFDAAITPDAVRFVHVLDADGQLVVQDDTPLGAVAAGETRAEAVTLTLPDDAPPGEYTVVTGWYSFPDLAPLRLLADPTQTRVTVGLFRLR
ncbi:MAG: hypothetical protein SF123_20820 [Chloroflexota bacterium]|nr:hypothetical protein [Chloroflexota bacterium]